MSQRQQYTTSNSRQYNYDKNDHKKPASNHTSAFLQKIQQESDRNRTRNYAGGSLSAQPSSSFTYHGAQQKAVASDQDTLDNENDFAYEPPLTPIKAPNTYHTSARYIGSSSPNAAFQEAYSDAFNRSPTNIYGQKENQQSRFQQNQSSTMTNPIQYDFHSQQTTIGTPNNNQFQIRIESPQPKSSSPPLVEANSSARNDGRQPLDRPHLLTSGYARKNQIVRSLSNENQSYDKNRYIMPNDVYHRNFIHKEDTGSQQTATPIMSQNFSNNEARKQNPQCQSSNQSSVLKGIRLGRSLDESSHETTANINIGSENANSFLEPQTSQIKQASHLINNYNKITIQPSKSDTSDTSYNDEGQSSLAESHSLSSSSTMTTIVNIPINTSGNNAHLWKQSASASSASLQSSPSHSITTICSSLNNTFHHDELQGINMSASAKQDSLDKNYLQRHIAPLVKQKNELYTNKQQYICGSILGEQSRLLSASLSPTPSTSCILTERSTPIDTTYDYPNAAYRTRSASSMSSRLSPSKIYQQALNADELFDKSYKVNSIEQFSYLKNEDPKLEFLKESAIATHAENLNPPVTFILEKSETVAGNMMDLDKSYTKSKKIIDVNRASFTNDNDKKLHEMMKSNDAQLIAACPQPEKDAINQDLNNYTSYGASEKRQVKNSDMFISVYSRDFANHEVNSKNISDQVKSTEHTKRADNKIRSDDKSKSNSAKKGSFIDAETNKSSKLKKELQHLREVNIELQKKVEYLEDFKLAHDNGQRTTALVVATNNMSRRISRAGTKFLSDHNVPSNDEQFKSSLKSSYYEKSSFKEGNKQQKLNDKLQVSSDERLESSLKGFNQKPRASAKHKKRDSLKTDKGINWTRNRSKSVGYGISRKPVLPDNDVSLQDSPPDCSRQSNQARDKYSKTNNRRFPWNKVKEAFGWINQPQSGNNGETFEDLPYSITVEDIVYDQESNSGDQQSELEDATKLSKEKQLSLRSSQDTNNNASQTPSRTSSKKWYNMKTIIAPNKKPAYQNLHEPQHKLPSKTDKNGNPLLMTEQHCESNIDNIMMDYTSEITTFSECSDNSSRPQHNSQEFFSFEDKMNQIDNLSNSPAEDKSIVQGNNFINDLERAQQQKNKLYNTKPESFQKEKTSEGSFSKVRINDLTTGNSKTNSEFIVQPNSFIAPTRSPSISSQAPPSPSYFSAPNSADSNKLNSIDLSNRNKSSRWKQMKKVFTNFDTHHRFPTTTDTASIMDVSLSPAQFSPSSSSSKCHFSFDIHQDKQQSTSDLSGLKVPTRDNNSTISIIDGTNNNVSVNNQSSGLNKSFFKKESCELVPGDTVKTNKFIPLANSKSTPVANLVDELQKNLTNDFSKKIQEWEKRKNLEMIEQPSLVENLKKVNACEEDQYGKKTPPHSRSASPTIGEISSHSVDQATVSNSAMHPCKGDKQKVNWLDKELQKIQKEWEKLRKEELKYEERASRLLRLRESVLRGDMVKDKREVFVKTAAGEFRFEGISHDFTKKLYEWETKKNVKMDMSTIALLDNQQYPEPSTSTKFGKASGAKKKRDGSKRNLGDCSPDDNYYCWLDENMFLLDQLRSKEEICRRLEAELNKLDEGMNKMSRQHELEMEKYRQKLWELHKLQSNPKDMETSIKLMTELKGKIDELQACGERLRNDKQALEDSFRYHSQQQAHLTIDLIEKMRDLQQLTYNKCGLQNSSQQESNNRTSQKRSDLKCDMESLCKLHELSTQLMDQARNLENRLAERTRQICQLRWELIDSDVKAMRIQTELESLKWQTSKRAALRRSRYGQKRSWSSSERLFHRVVELDETIEVRSSNCELAAAPSMRGSSYEFVEFPSSDLSDWLKVDEESGSISDTVQLLKLELLKLGTLNNSNSVGTEIHSVQSGSNSMVCDQADQDRISERDENELRHQDIASIASESSEASGILGLNDSQAEKEAYVIRLPRKRMDHIKPQSIVTDGSYRNHNQSDGKGQISTMSNIISSSSLDSQSMVEEEINRLWDMRSSTTCDPPTSTTNTSINTASVVATSSDSNNSLDSNSLPIGRHNKSFQPPTLDQSIDGSLNDNRRLCTRQSFSQPSTSKSQLNENDPSKDSKLCTEFYKSRQVFVKLTECAKDERPLECQGNPRSSHRRSIRNKTDCKKNES